MPWWPRTLRGRLTLWFTVVLGTPLIAFAIGAYVFLSRTLLDRTDQFISDALSAFSHELTAERRAASSDSVAILSTTTEVRFRDMQIVVLDSMHRPLAIGAPPETGDDAGTREAAAQHAASLVMEWLRAHRAANGSVLTVPTPDESFRVGLRTTDFHGRQLHLAGIYPLTAIDTILDRVRRALFIVIPLMLVAAAVGGYFLARRSLAPVSAMGARAAAITASSLHERLPVATPHDELADLARVINGLLDRLQASFEQQRRFMADASHELRTPAAVLKTETDVTLSREHRTESEYRDSLQVISNASTRLTKIVDELFLLARADAGHLIVRREPIYLEEVVHDAVRAVQPLAEQAAVQLELTHVIDAPFLGDADMLGRLVLNLLDNAIKYSPPRTLVDVSMSATATTYHIAVRDSGNGIPAEAQGRLFERFFRVDSARSRAQGGSTSGAGLGLAIARHIAEAHRGTVALIESRPGRTEFRISLPRDGDAGG